MNRLRQVVLIVATLTFCWLAMQAVHEFGHVLHAWLSGGKVALVVLRPLAISRTDVAPNPHPQFVAWGGPLWGSLIPLAVFGMTRWRSWSRAWLAQFFAGFCLVANGAYLLGGSLYPVGDAEVLLMSGAPRVTLVLFGIVALPLGIALWNGLGKHFGIGRESLAIDRQTTWGMAAAAGLLVLVELVFSWEIRL